jgi:hypothetical protein
MMNIDDALELETLLFWTKPHAFVVLNVHRRSVEIQCCYSMLCLVLLLLLLVLPFLLLLFLFACDRLHHLLLLGLQFLVKRNLSDVFRKRKSRSARPSHNIKTAPIFILVVNEW